MDDRLAVGESAIEGRGLFFSTELRSDTVVIRLGGRLVPFPEFSAMIAMAERDPEVPYVDTITIRENEHLVLPPETPIHFGNRRARTGARGLGAKWSNAECPVATRNPSVSTRGIMAVMPVAFYFVTHDSVGRSVRALAFGISWAVSTVAFFATAAARDIDPRLRLAGWRSLDLLVGRLLGLCSAVLVLVAAFGALVAVDQPVRSVAAVITTFAVTGLVAVAVGTAIGTLIAPEMEGALVLFFLAGMQAIANPFDAWSRALPFWSSRELGTWAIDGPAVGSLGEGLAHAVATLALCGVVVVAASARGRKGGHQAR